MTSLLETFASYVPTLVARSPAPGKLLRDGPAREQHRAALLFADISGFTALAERLGRQGPDGVEELTRLLNISFSQILDLVESHGGDVVRFAGDALLALWPADSAAADGDTLALAAQRAALCGLGIHARMSNFYRLIDSAPLRLRIGIAAGDIAAMHIGGVFNRWEFLVTGGPLVEVGAAEHLAQPGEVVLAPSAWWLLGGVASGTVIGAEGGDQQRGRHETRDTRHEIQDTKHEQAVTPKSQPAELATHNSSFLTHNASLATLNSPNSYLRLQGIQPLAPRTLQRPLLEAEANAALRAYIPGAVLSRIVAGQSSWLAELRPVTVIFANLPDISHETPVTQAHAAMRALQAALYRHEGSVNKISLDDKGVTLIAALGLPPLAHEDDAVRGVQAALAMQQALHELGLRSAIGVATGRAFCGEIGSPQRREYTMIGATVNLAARLMQAALHMPPPDASDPAALPVALLCDEATFLAARARMAFATLPPILVKGKTELVPVFCPLGAALQRRTDDTRPARHSSLIGRTSELATLTGELQALVRGGAGGVVLIEGEAGLGKSRLLEALRHAAADLRITSFTGGAEAMERETPYHAWRDVFSQLFDLSVLNAPEARRRHILDLLEDDEELLTFAPLLNAVLPLELPETATTSQLAGPARAQATRDLLLRLLQESAARSPKLILLEDAHWFDSASWALALTVSRIQRLLVVISLRPLASTPTPDGSTERRLGTRAPSESASADYAQLGALARHWLRLESLPPDDAVMLVSRRLGVHALPEPVAALIREKGQGNPFFCEELAYALRDAGQIEIIADTCRLAPGADLRALAFPETVQGAILSRIDRLSPTQQLTLKVASVIGRVFPVRTLHAVYPVETSASHLSTDLNNLVRLDITLPDAPEPEVAYSFKHAITQDVVYNLMLFAQRRQLHRSVAEWYERQYADDLARLYPLLAYHWRHAGVAAKALDYLEKAGQHALRSSALREARTLFEQGLALLAGPGAAALPDAARRRLALTQSLADALHFLGEFTAAREQLEASLALARADDDRQAVIDILSRLGWIATEIGAFGEARRALEESLALARKLNEPARLAATLAHLSNVALRSAEHAEAIGYAQESLALYTRIGDRSGVARVLNHLGSCAVDQGQLLKAQECYEESLAIHRSLGDRRSAAGALSNLGWVAHLLGSYREARERYEAALALARAVGDQRAMAIVLNNLGFTFCELGDDQAARAAFDEALGLARTIGATPLLLEVAVGLARLAARAGQPEQAAELVGAAANHPASSFDVRMQVDLFLRELRPLLSAEALAAAQMRGAAQPIEVLLALVGS